MYMPVCNMEQNCFVEQLKILEGDLNGYTVNLKLLHQKE